MAIQFLRGLLDSKMVGYVIFLLSNPYLITLKYFKAISMCKTAWRDIDRMVVDCRQ